MKGWRCARQMRRALATAGRLIPLAGKVSFVAEARPVQPAADRSAMHPQIMGGGQRIADCVERRTGMRHRQPHDPRVMTARLAPPRIALPPGVRRSGRPLQLHPVVRELRRNPKMPRVRHRARTNGAPMAHPGGHSPPPRKQRPAPEAQQDVACPHWTSISAMQTEHHKQTSIEILNLTDDDRLGIRDLPDPEQRADAAIAAPTDAVVR